MNRVTDRINADTRLDVIEPRAERLTPLGELSPTLATPGLLAFGAGFAKGAAAGGAVVTAAGAGAAVANAVDGG